MEPMPPTPAHAKPASRRDHLWVLVIIALCCLIKVWPSWVGIGAEAGFPKLGRMATYWTLAVVIEAYWAYAVYAWLAASAGRRSRLFAMWSAAAVFALSLLGQGAERLVPAAAMTVFANILPVTVLALIAVLVHLRQKDREDAAETDERSAVQAEMDALRERVETLARDLETVRSERDEAVANAETLTRKLEAATARKRRAATGRKPARATARKQEPVTGSATAPEEAPADLDSEAKVLWYFDKGYSASKAGLAAGLTDSRGRQIVRELAAAAPRGQDPEE